MKGFALGLPLKQRRKATRKSPILLSNDKNVITRMYSSTAFIWVVTPLGSIFESLSHFHNHAQLLRLKHSDGPLDNQLGTQNGRLLRWVRKPNLIKSPKLCYQLVKLKWSFRFCSRSELLNRTRKFATSPWWGSLFPVWSAIFCKNKTKRPLDTRKQLEGNLSRTFGYHKSRMQRTFPASDNTRLTRTSPWARECPN